jgi:hypothetical protein
MPTVSRKTRILFIQPDLNDQPGLVVRKELRNLDQALLLEGKDAVWEWKLLPSAQIDDLERGLARYQPDIVHYAGHGAAQGELFFDPKEDKKNSVALSAEDFAETLRIHQARPHTPRVRLVVLAACNTERTAQLAVEHVDCAIGMRGEIGDGALVKVVTRHPVGQGSQVRRSGRGWLDVPRRATRAAGHLLDCPLSHHLCPVPGVPGRRGWLQGGSLVEGAGRARGASRPLG